MVRRNKRLREARTQQDQSETESPEIYLRLSALEVFEALFQKTAADIGKDRLEAVLGAIANQKPAKSEEQLVQSWTAVLAAGYGVLAESDIGGGGDGADVDDRLSSLYSLLFPYLEAEHEGVREDARSALVVLNGVLVRGRAPPALDKITDLLAQGLSVRYADAFTDVCEIIASLIKSLGENAAPGLLGIIVKVGMMRSEEDSERQSGADRVLGAAIRALGPEVVLDLLPLNLGPNSGKGPMRGWMLKLLRDNIFNASLAHFISTFVPLSDELYLGIKETGPDAEKNVHDSKVCETVISQIWDLFPAYCNFPVDVVESFDETFAKLLSSLLYSQIQLRPVICRALCNLISTSKQLVDLDNEQEARQLYKLSPQDGAKAQTHISALSRNFLAVLLNVYSKTLPQHRQAPLETIRAFMSITNKEDMLHTLTELIQLIENSDWLENPRKEKLRSDQLPPISQTALDMLVGLIDLVPDKILQRSVELAKKAVTESDAAIQKRGYKILASACDRTMDMEREGILDLLQSTSGNVGLAAWRERLSLIERVIGKLSSEELHFIPIVLSEVILGTKSNNERARTTAYDLIVKMGCRMNDGGMIQNHKLKGMPSDAPSPSASIDEFITMVSAGLAGSTPQMISATITALSRILYEFVDKIGDQMLDELLSTMDVFVTSRNREIARSALGFQKVTFAVLPETLLETRLSEMIPNLMVWSHEHKGHFRSKVKHMLERLMRRFGYEKIGKYVPEEDQKLLTAIRKARARRKKKGETADTKEEDLRTGHVQKGYAGLMEDSDVSDENELEESQGAETFLVEDADEPLDLLDAAALSHVTRVHPQTKAAREKRRQERSEEKRKALVTAETSDGRIVLGRPAVKKIEENEENLYMRAKTDPEGFTRGHKGRIKFKKRKRTVEIDD